MDEDINPLVRVGLVANAVLSLVLGLLLASAPGTVGEWLGVAIDGWLRLLGIILVGHSGLLVVAARQADPTALAKLNLVTIAPYPVLMVGLVATGLVDRTLGQGLVLADGVAVGLIAIVQFNGLRRVETMPDPTIA